MEPNLYIVVLGGKVRSSNIEQHDVRWVVGTSIEETYSQLRTEWFGLNDGLHIDSYMKVNYIDGFKIVPTRTRPALNLNANSKSQNKLLLWFVNLGAYDPNELYELHQFTLVVSHNSLRAKTIAMNRCLCNCNYRHKDNINTIPSSTKVDCCNIIENINGWIICLEKDPLNRSQKIIPDFYGFIPIYKSSQVKIPL